MQIKADLIDRNRYNRKTHETTIESTRKIYFILPEVETHSVLDEERYEKAIDELSQRYGKPMMPEAAYYRDTKSTDKLQAAADLIDNTAKATIMSKAAGIILRRIYSDLDENRYAPGHNFLDRDYDSLRLDDYVDIATYIGIPIWQLLDVSAPGTARGRGVNWPEHIIAATEQFRAEKGLGKLPFKYQLNRALVQDFGREDEDIKDWVWDTLIANPATTGQPQPF